MKTEKRSVWHRSYIVSATAKRFSSTSEYTGLRTTIAKFHKAPAFLSIQGLVNLVWERLLLIYPTGRRTIVGGLRGFGTPPSSL